MLSGVLVLFHNGTGTPWRLQKKVEVIRACSGRMWQSAHGGDTGESILMVQNPDIICIHVNMIVWLCQAVRTSVLNSLNL